MSQFVSEKEKLKALTPGALYRHRKDLYEVQVVELYPPLWPGARQRLSFRRAAETANGNFKKLRIKLARDFLAAFSPAPAPTPTPPAS